MKKIFLEANEQGLSASEVREVLNISEDTKIILVSESVFTPRLVLPEPFIIQCVPACEQFYPPKNKGYERPYKYHR